MQKAIFSFLLRLSGWKMALPVPEGTDRCVMVAAPHTSNWDFYYTILAFRVMDIPLRFTIKKSWMRFPFNLLIGPLGGLGIDRKPKAPGQARPSYVEAMAELFAQHQRLAVVVTPEGTRSPRDEWKTGFYYTALKAGVPIMLGYLNYQQKEAGVGGPIHPSGDLAADMRKIMDFYRDIPGHTPGNFLVDKRYG
ncbi:MAG: acyltransferase [Bacteroidetes bacterium]|nr:MAG: acyltransferase [Bacteroidota bacterium]